MRTTQTLVIWSKAKASSCWSESRRNSSRRAELAKKADPKRFIIGNDPFSIATYRLI
jgi:hypothetical protein